MLEECLVRVISRIIVNNNVYFDYEAIFILFARKYDCVPFAAVFMYMCNLKVISRWLHPPRIQCGGIREKYV